MFTLYGICMSKINITLTVNGAPVGIAQKMEYKYTRDKAGYNSFSCGRVRFDKLNTTGVFHKNIINAQHQNKPLELVVESDGDVIVIHNAYVTSTQYSYHAGDHIIVEQLEVFSEDITCTSSDKIMCRYCTERTAVMDHDWWVAALTDVISKKFILESLGLSPKDSTISQACRLESIEILKGHFPDMYKEMEGLFVLI